MGRVIVSLISKETIPNVLFLKEKYNIDDKLLFITTEKMEEDNIIDNILYGSKLDDLDKNLIKRITVEAYRLYSIQRKIEEETKRYIKDADDVIVNITGGTKIMSLSVYIYFQSIGAEIYYSPIGKNLLRKIFPRKYEQNEETISYRLGVEEYLKSYGINSKKPEDVKKEFIEHSKIIFENYVNSENYYNNFISFSEHLRPHRNKKNVEISTLNEENQNLLKQIYKKNIKSLNKDEIRYLTGEWLEIYIYQVLKELIDENEGEVWPSFDFFKGVDKVQNELDIVFTYNNNFNILECKTYLSQDGKSKILNDILYKANTVRKECGLNTRSILVILDRNLNKTENKRAKAYNIEFITFNEINSVDKLQDKLKSLLR